MVDITFPLFPDGEATIDVSKIVHVHGVGVLTMIETTGDGVALIYRTTAPAEIIEAFIQSGKGGAVITSTDGPGAQS